MAEQEITYIPYGQDEISQQDLMTNLANGLPDFVKSYKWLQKPGITEKFLNAYKDIINHGITGASNSSGLWEITHNGDKIDTSTMSPIDKQIYEHAAYYIQQKMAQMTPRKKEEETAKKDLKDFNFINDFKTSILNEYGGQQALFSDPETGWNSLDPRGDNGLRGIDKRRDKVKTILQNYLRDYKDGQYNFEGTPFKDDADVKAKVQKAIDALDTIDNTTDDVEAFNALGLPYRTYFSNGGNEATNKINPATGTPFTYNEWNKYQQEQKELKAKQAQQNAYNNTLFLYRVTNPKMQGQNPVALKQKYKNSNSLMAALQNYSQRDIRTLTPDEQSEVHGAYRNLATEPIDSNLLNRIKNSSSGFYKDSTPNRFRKIKGIDNLIWDSKLNQVIQLNNKQQQQAIQNQPQDLFANIQTPQELQDKQQNTPRGNGVELTDADKRDIFATLADLGALVNPEVFTGTAMALSASGARTWNSIEQNGLWNTLADWKTWADWGTGALGGTALLGDASSAVKVIKGFGQLMTIPMVYNSLKSIPEAKAAWDKIDLDHPIDSAKKLTPQDYHALSTFLMGIISGKNYLRNNLAERQVLKQSGINTESKSKIREYSNKLGLTRTKAQDQQTVSTLKVKKTGEDGKVDEKAIPLNEKQKAAIQKAKASEVEKVAKAEGVKIPEGYKVEVNKSKINAAKSYFGKGNSEVIGSQTQTASRGEDKFENWLENRSIWNKWALGTNRNLRQIRENLGIKPVQENSETPKTETPKVETPTSTPKKWAEIEKGPSKWSRSAEAKEYEDILRGKFGSNAIQGGVHKVGDLTIDVDIPRPGATNGFAEVNFKDGSKQTIRFNTQKQLQEQVAKIIKERRIQTDSSGKKTKVDIKEMSKILKSLKSKGFLKQGGKVNPSLDEVIKDFINNNNI